MTEIDIEFSEKVRVTFAGSIEAVAALARVMTTPDREVARAHIDRYVAALAGIAAGTDAGQAIHVHEAVTDLLGLPVEYRGTLRNAVERAIAPRPALDPQTV